MIFKACFFLLVLSYKNKNYYNTFVVPFAFEFFALRALSIHVYSSRFDNFYDKLCGLIVGKIN